jgi:hypothetical protein
MPRDFPRAADQTTQDGMMVARDRLANLPVFQRWPETSSSVAGPKSLSTNIIPYFSPQSTPSASRLHQRKLWRW